MTTRISDISFTGLVTVKFSEKVIVPGEYKLFNETVFKIWIDSIYEIGLARWQITSFTNAQMQIQLNITNPTYVSLSSVT